MSKRQQRPIALNRQGGAVLMVAMIMIFMLSLLGLSSMRNSSLEHRMAVNSIHTQDVLQAAESSNEIVLNNNANLVEVLNETTQAKTFPTTIRANSGLSTQVVLRCIGDGNAIGATLDASQDATSFDSLHFVAEGSASITAVRASRRVDQGAFLNVPRGTQCSP